MAPTALIVGVTGIAGRNLAEHLLAEGWAVHGLARHPETAPTGVQPIAADLLDPASVKAALAGHSPTHVFLTTWLRQATEKENCAVNGAMVRNLLDALSGAGSVEHVALVTGLKHYLGPFEAYARSKPETPFREEQPRLPIENFYYVQEDEVFAAAERQGFGWSVHRPHSLIGYALGNAMNMGVTLACYAAICKETGRPFVFPGSPQQHEGATDVTDARLLARQLAWAATAPAARNEAFNIVNGEIFRWRWLWPRLAALYGVEAAPYPGQATPLVQQMQDAGPVWDQIVARHGLAPNRLDHLASWWHSDADLGRPIECFTDMSKSRRLGFMDYQETLPSFADVYARLQAERVVLSGGSMAPSILLAFAITFAVACALPGPTVAALLARVLGRGTAGVPAFCAGLMLGDLVWLSAAVLGLAVLAATMQPVFLVIRYAGAAYLLYLAWRLWTAPATPPEAAAPVAGEGARLFLAGLSVALGNPKTMLFYLALLPTMIDLQHLTFTGFAELALIIAVVYGSVLTAYVTLAARARRLIRSARAMRCLNRTTGTVMAGAAVAIAAR